MFANDRTSEGTDRTSLTLPGQQAALINAVAAANPHTVVVLNTGSAVTMPWLDDVRSVLEMWYPGQQYGTALASLLFGDVNPSGKLPVTFPTDDKQGPWAAGTQQYPGDGTNVTFSEGLQVGYRWYRRPGRAAAVPVRLRPVLHHIRLLQPHAEPGRRHHDGELRRHQHRPGGGG